MKEHEFIKNSKLLNINNRNNSFILFLSFVKWIFIGTLVGAITGVLGALFLESLNLATDLRNNHTWLLFLLPLGGGLVSYLYWKHGKDAGRGNNLIIERINEKDVAIPLRMAPLVFLGTFLSHLFGASVGREGTGVQIGATVSQGISRIFKLDKIDHRIILMAGISSGFSSVFGTPLAGTVFGLEVAALGFMSYEAIVPCFTASLVGDLMVSFLGVHHSHFFINGIPSISLEVILKVTFAAILFGLTSKLFSNLTHYLKAFFSSKFKNPVVKTMLGGVLVIISVYLVGTRDFLGLSLPLMNKAFEVAVSPLNFILKLLFTTLSLGVGFQGGEVTPLFVIGSSLGSSLSSILNMAPSFLAALGLIGVFTGATNAPLASFILSIELFGSEASIYMFMVCVISYIFSGHNGIYSSQKIMRSKSRLIPFKKESTLNNK